MILPVLLILLLVGALLPVVLRDDSRLAWRLAVVMPALASFLCVCAAGVGVLGSGESLQWRHEWVAAFDLSIGFHLNGLALMMAGLVTGIGTLIISYALGYMGGKEGTMRLCGLLYLFMFAMTGVVVSDHLLMLFIFWELTSISSYLLIGFNHESASARRCALQALVVTGLGGLALLAGFILVHQMTGTWWLSELLSGEHMVAGHPLYLGALSLVLLGAFTKSAQFPFHFWLPNAMAAPTPVSAYLHSATMVKAGVFLMLVIQPVLGGTEEWSQSLMMAGGITMVLALIFGLRQVDLKKILAATTLAVLGILTLLIGIDTKYSILAAIVFLLGHALYKATLFMTAGAVDHSTGTRDIRVLGGLRGSMPLTAAAGLLASFSMMGLPLFFGFLGKEYAYKSAVGGSWLTIGVLVIGNATMMVLAARAGVLPFMRKPMGKTPKVAHEMGWFMAIGPLILAATGLVIGCFPGIVSPIVSLAYTGIVPGAEPYHLALWHGVNLPLLLSLGTFAIGFLLMYVLKPSAVGKKVNESTFADAVYERSFKLVLLLARWCTRTLQTGHLRSYVIIIMVSSCALILWKLSRFGGWPTLENLGPVNPFVVCLLVAMTIATMFAVFAQGRLTAVVSLGVVGYGIAMLYAKYSAPDLAITQVLVETLTVVLFAWVVRWLPKYRKLSTGFQRFMDCGLAIVTGAIMTVLMLKSQSLLFGPKVSDKLAEMSYPEGYGANVVNVILVDFRALDTFGEIAVLAIAALGVWALVDSAVKKKGNK
ncbi:hydrogen gas-evolving membrane-bound hydrogenase subunit E [Rubritalea tangerina]|uniref:Hydrogen gas-evolving membrane-bound hydrogenase subunit E n=1 Tax=Rubritalea tangerina TaxID=430798 RepID=A0ABW4Z6B8_9BACT